MTIDDYSFGRIVIDGKAYTADVIIYPDRVDATWWRREGHRLAPEDLPGVLSDPPEVLVIGTGHDGCMKVPAETLERLRAGGTEVLVARTGEAVGKFNRRRKEQPRTAAALHLTC